MFTLNFLENLIQKRKVITMETCTLKVVLALLCIHVGHVLSQTGTNAKDLIDNLFTTNAYSTKVRPIADQTQSVTVTVEFFLSEIIDFNDEEETLKLSAFLSLEWTDAYLTWTPASYGGLTTLFLPQDDIWKPDVTLRNSDENLSDSGMGSSYLHARVDNSGTVTWTPFQIFESTCDVDVTYYPFDVQECKLKFTAWSYRKWEVEMRLFSTRVQLADYSENSVWGLVSVTTSEVQDSESAIVYTLKLKRKPSFFLISYISPIVLLTVLNIATFILPVPHGGRAGYAMTVFLSIVVFLTIFASELPQNSDTVSLLAVYLILMSTLSTLVVLVSLFQCRLREYDRIVPVPEVNKVYRGIYVIYEHMRCRRCRRCYKRDKNVSPSEVNVQEKDQEMPQSDVMESDVTWLNVLDAIDFLSFWFCLLFTFIITLALTAAATAHSAKYDTLDIQDGNRL